MMKNPRNYIEKPSRRKGRMTNVPMGQTMFESQGNGNPANQKTGNPSGRSGTLTRDGLVWRNNLLDTDYTDQQATRRKTKGV